MDRSDKGATFDEGAPLAFTAVITDLAMETAVMPISLTILSPG
jgi:hypothetical protein